MAYNSLFLSHFGTPDWDMFQSTHPDAELHAAARAISGGPVYVSDAPDAHSAALLRSLVLPDGSVLRCEHGAKPTRQSLFDDPNADGATALTLWARNAVTGVLGAFNVQGARWDRATRRFVAAADGGPTVGADLRPEMVEGLAPSAQRGGGGAEGEAAAAEWVAYGHHSGVPQLLKSGEQIEIGDLAPRDWELFVVAPLERLGGVAWAPIGLLGMLNAGGGVEASALGRGFARAPQARARVRTPGTFGAYCSEAPRLVRVGGAVVPFEYDASSGLLRVDVSDDAAEIAANAAAGDGEKQVRTAEVAVDFAFGARANLRLRQQPKRDDAPNTVEVTNVEVLNRIRSLVAPPVPRVGLGAFGHAVDDAEEVE